MENSPVKCQNEACGKIDYSNYALWVKVSVQRYEGTKLREVTIELCDDCRHQVPVALQALKPEWFENG